MAKIVQLGGEAVSMVESTDLLAAYVSGTAAACGTASTEITVPTGASSAMIHAAGAAVYWQINGSDAGTASPGYVAADQTGVLPPMSNFGTLHVAGAGTAAVAHIEFYND